VSEQPEIGHATNIMCSRFLSGSQRISTHLSWLAEHAEEIRAEARASVSAAAAKIEATQKRLTAQMDRLPAPQWERFKAMLTLLRAQQGVLESAEALVESARANAVPRKPPPVAGPATPTASVAPNPVQRKYPVATRQSKSVVRGAASPRLALLAIVAGGLVFGYVTFPRDSKRQDVATKPVALTDTSNIGSSVASPPPRPEHDLATAGPETAPTPAATKAHREPMSISTTPYAAPASGTVAATVPAPVPGGDGAANRANAAAIARAGERFVPVVFTDKDKARVLRAFSELQMRYPKLLRQRQAEAQPIDVGQKGIWHRLIVLPPSSHQSATDFCDQLLAAGYARCWVMGY